MAIVLNNSIIKIFRDEEDNYFTYLSGNTLNAETRETEGKFYIRRKIKFSDNQEVKNKSRIKIIDGFLSPYRLKVRNERGEYTYVSGEIYHIKEFVLVEDGILEKQKIFKNPNKSHEQFNPRTNKQSKELNPFSFNEYGDVTPF